MGKVKIRIFLTALLAHYSVAFALLFFFANVCSFSLFGLGFLLTALLGVLILFIAKRVFTKKSVVRALIQYPKHNLLLILSTTSLIGWAIGAIVGTLVFALFFSTGTQDASTSGALLVSSAFGCTFGGYFGAIFGALYADAAIRVYYRKQKFSFTGAFLAVLCGILLHLTLIAIFSLATGHIFIMAFFLLSLYFSILLYIPIITIIIFTVCTLYRRKNQ